MISHDCLMYLISHIGIDVCRTRQFDERIVSYLPLSHIAAQSVDIFLAICSGATVYFAQPDALKGSLVKTLKEVRPTFFFGVPRVWEKMQENVEKVLGGLTGAKLNLLNWARKVASKQIMADFHGRGSSINPAYSLAKMLVLNNVHRQLGLDAARHTISGAAPITRETLDFFYSLGIPLCETYGMSESTGPHIVGVAKSNRATSVGPIAQFNRSKIINKDSDDSGELCMYGRHVYMGYLNDAAKTKETFDEDGWLRTGDIAKINENFIYITGRLKELIITAGGENIPPVPIENNLKAELPNLISGSILIGDKRKYLVILVTLKVNKIIFLFKNRCFNSIIRRIKLEQPNSVIFCIIQLYNDQLFWSVINWADIFH
jgi:long-chain-fatty-acid--CoA ligase ACSBG